MNTACFLHIIHALNFRKIVFVFTQANSLCVMILTRSIYTAAVNNSYFSSVKCLFNTRPRSDLIFSLLSC